MKKLLLVFVLISTTCGLFGQDDFKQNDIYLEAGGNGLFASLNYERQLTKLPGLGVRVGVGFYTENAFFLTIPVGINYLFKLKKPNAFIDAGLGVTWANIDGKLFGSYKSSNTRSFVNFMPSIGYRRHTANDLMYRLSITPVINKNTFVPWLGLSIGKRF